MLPHTEGTVINQSLKIEIVEVKNSSQQALNSELNEYLIVSKSI
jgi:hypothetical protein